MLNSATVATSTDSVTRSDLDFLTSFFDDQTIRALKKVLFDSRKSLAQALNHVCVDYDPAAECYYFKNDALDFLRTLPFNLDAGISPRFLLPDMSVFSFTIKYGGFTTHNTNEMTWFVHEDGQVLNHFPQVLT